MTTDTINLNLKARNSFNNLSCDQILLRNRVLNFYELRPLDIRGYTKMSAGGQNDVSFNIKHKNLITLLKLWSLNYIS